MSDQRRFRTDLDVFQVQGRIYSAREVLEAADFRGELRSRWGGFLEAEACVRAVLERGLEPDADGLQSMADEFRYERDLVTAEETEAWLEDRGATAEEFDDYFVRRYWAAALPDAQRVRDVDRPFAADDIDEAFGTDLVLSGDFFRMALLLGRRAAALAACGENGEPPREAIERERSRLAEREGIFNPIVGAWPEDLLKLEAAYIERCRAALSEKARARLLQTMRLSLTRLTVETIEVDSTDAARETLLCVRDDGIEMVDLATQQRYPYERAELFLDDLDEGLQKTFLAGAPGDVWQLTRSEGRHEVCRLVQKLEPHLSDERVAARIDEIILDAHFSELTRQAVRWLIPDETAA